MKRVPQNMAPVLAFTKSDVENGHENRPKSKPKNKSGKKKGSKMPKNTGYLAYTRSLNPKSQEGDKVSDSEKSNKKNENNKQYAPPFKSNGKHNHEEEKQIPVFNGINQLETQKSTFFQSTEKRSPKKQISGKVRNFQPKNYCTAAYKISPNLENLPQIEPFVPKQKIETSEFTPELSQTSAN